MPQKLERDPDTRTPRDIAVAIAAVEFFSILVALVTPITPSKTGSTWSPAQLVTPDPSYIEEVGASFIFINALIAFLGLVAYGLTWARRSR